MSADGTETQGVTERTVEMMRLLTEVKANLLRLEVLIATTMNVETDKHPTGLKLKSGELFHFTQAEVAWLQDHYPSLNVEQELGRMAEWCEHNPSRRKTDKGIKRFVTAWLKKSAKNSRQDPLDFLK